MVYQERRAEDSQLVYKTSVTCFQAGAVFAVPLSALQLCAGVTPRRRLVFHGFQPCRDCCISVTGHSSLTAHPQKKLILICSPATAPPDSIVGAC